MSVIIRRYRERLNDEREYISGPYHVELIHWPFRSEVKVWKDVGPALGGLISRRVMRDAEAEHIYDEAIRVIEEER